MNVASVIRNPGSCLGALIRTMVRAQRDSTSEEYGGERRKNARERYHCGWQVGEQLKSNQLGIEIETAWIPRRLSPK